MEPARRQGQIRGGPPQGTPHPWRPAGLLLQNLVGSLFLQAVSTMAEIDLLLLLLLVLLLLPLLLPLLLLLLSLLLLVENELRKCYM